MADFVRFQSAVPNRRGTFPGVFAMANGLLGCGLLSAADAHWLLDANKHAGRAYLDPAQQVPECYDRDVNPGARAWFKSDASGLLDMTRAYLDLLDRYGVPWVELRTRTPGRIVYDDVVQVVAVPYQYPDDWPLDRRENEGAGRTT